MKSNPTLSAQQVLTFNVPTNQGQAPSIKDDNEAKDLNFKFYKLMIFGYKILQITTIIACIFGVLLFGFGLTYSIINASSESIVVTICGPLISIISALMIKPLNGLRKKLQEALSAQVKHTEIKGVIASIKDPQTKEKQQIRYLDYLFDKDKKAQDERKAS